MLNRLVAMPYFGGKSRKAINVWLNSMIPHEKDSLYCEPFAGMLGLLLSRPPAGNEIVNDLDNNIYIFWSAVRDYPDRLDHMIKHTLHCRQSFFEARELLKSGKEKADIVKHAWAVYVVIQHGITHGLGHTTYCVYFGQGKKKMGGDRFSQRIMPLHNRLKDVQIENKDAVDLLERLSSLDYAVVYCDPPYEFADTYAYGQERVTREKMSEILLCQRGRVAISGYGAEWDHLGWNKKVFVVPFTGIGKGKKKRDPQRTECLWMNYDANVQMALF